MASHAPAAPGKPDAVLAHDVLIDGAAILGATRWPVYRSWREPGEGGLGANDASRIAVLLTPGNRPVTAALMDRLPALALIAGVGAGHEGIDIAAAKARGIAVTNFGGAYDGDIADWALGALIYFLRDMREGDRFVREGDWMRRESGFGPSLSTRTVGIVGLGGVGTAVAQRCAAVGMHVLWWGPRHKPSPFERAASVAMLAERSDAVVLACPLNAETRGFVGSDLLSAIGPRGYLVNVSRGPVVDEAALIEALDRGRIAGAALDVFDDEPTPPERWRDVPNTLLGPHRAGGTKERMTAMVQRCLENIACHFEGRPLLDRVA